jgi:hypothetical protein
MPTKFGTVTNVSKEELLTAMVETGKHKRAEMKKYLQEYNSKKKNEKGKV